MEKIQPCMCFHNFSVHHTLLCPVLCHSILSERHCDSFFVVLVYDMVFALCCRPNCSLMYYFELYERDLCFDILF